MVFNKKRKGKNIFFSGLCIDNETGRKVHKYESNDLEEFDEFFTKTMRRKML